MGYFNLYKTLYYQYEYANYSVLFWGYTMNTAITLKSKIDTSINNIVHIGPLANDIVETRIVQRSSDTLIFYLSTHTGCANSCRMCWLTQTHQVSNQYLNFNNYHTQLEWIVSQLNNDPRLSVVKTCHINFMARGDALSSPTFMMFYNELTTMIRTKIQSLFINIVIIKFKISTIFPQDCMIDLTNGGMRHWLDINTSKAHDTVGTEFYYSLYSLSNDFRRKWLPKAVHPHHIGELFKGSRSIGDYHPFRLHHALIDGENDSIKDCDAILEWLNKYDIICPVNIVRYNPYIQEGIADGKCGKESDLLDFYVSYMRQSPRVSHLNIIQRVGKDVYASCGMFTTHQF